MSIQVFYKHVHAVISLYNFTVSLRMYLCLFGEKGVRENESMGAVWRMVTLRVELRQRGPFFKKNKK